MGLNTTEEFRLVSLGLEAGRAGSPAEAFELIVRRIGDGFGLRCLVRARSGNDWRTVAQIGTPLRAAEIEKAVRISIASDGSTELLMACRPNPEPDAALLLANPGWQEAVGGIVAAALQLVQFRCDRQEIERQTERLGRFSRTVLGLSDTATLHRTIVEHMARAVEAEIGSLAIYVPQENALAVTATYGYPAVLVEHVRIAPGDGIIGRVFSSAEPMIATGPADFPNHVTRRRYRSDSFLALPLAGPDGVVAVVSFTDKASGQFGQGDLSLLALMAVPAALAVSREVLRDRTNDLAHLATVDPLTGLFNRRYFETRLEQELQRQQRQSDELSLLMLDLDNFKELNDRHGHLVGDTALREVAEILRRAVRIFDVCSRYGGEEFVILMPGAGPSTALRIAERIRRQVEQHFATGRRTSVPIPLTVSIGVSTARPSVTRDALIAQADEGLLLAKTTGKNQVVRQSAE